MDPNGPPLYPGEKSQFCCVKYSARLQCFPVATLGKCHGSHSKDGYSIVYILSVSSLQLSFSISNRRGTAWG